MSTSSCSGAGHIAGAVSIPLDELGNRLDELSDEFEVVAYCRGPYVERLQLLLGG